MVLDIARIVSPLPLIVLSALVGFLAGHLTSHKQEPRRRLQLAAEYEISAERWEALAHEMAADDHLRAGINIGTDHVLASLETYLAEVREEQEQARVRYGPSGTTNASDSSRSCAGENGQRS